jgi:AraC family transcriptional regulator
MDGNAGAKQSSFHGETLHQREVRGFVLRELCYGPNVFIPLHRHANAYASFVLEGSFKARDAATEHSVEQGTLLFHPAGESHVNQFSRRGARLLCIEITAPAIEQLEMRGLNLSSGTVQMGRTAAWFGQRIFLQYRREDPASTLLAEGMILGLISELLGAEAARPKTRPATTWMEAAVGYIQRGFRHEMRLEQIAKAAGVHPVHLARTFRRVHGCTVGDYTRFLRLEDACKKLIATKKSVTELALECGFADHSHFCHAFYKRFGLSPTQFRRAHRR